MSKQGMDEERRKNGCAVEPSCMRRTSTVEDSRMWVATRWILRLISHAIIHPFSIHPLCFPCVAWRGGKGWRKYSRCREKDKRILVWKKKEGRKKDLVEWIISSRTHPVNPPLTSPHLSDRDSGTRVPRSSAIRCWPNVASGGSRLQGDDARTFVYASGLSSSSRALLLLLVESLPSFSTLHSTRPPSPPRKSTSAMSISLPNGTLLAASSSSHLQLSAAVTRILHLANFSAEYAFPRSLGHTLTLHADSRPATSSSCSKNGITTRAATE